jgi:hypothetical protein
MTACKFPKIYYQDYGYSAADLLFWDNTRAAKNPDYIKNDKTIKLITDINNNIGEYFVSDGRITNYEIKQPDGYGLGYSKGYGIKDGGGIVMTVYAFHARVADWDKLSTDSSTYKKEWDNNVDSVMQSQGVIDKNLSKLENTIETIENVKFNKLKIGGFSSQFNKEVLSEMYLTIYNGALLKLRITYSKSDASAVEPVIKQFISGLIKSINENNK